MIGYWYLLLNYGHPVHVAQNLAPRRAHPQLHHCCHAHRVLDLVPRRPV